MKNTLQHFCDHVFFMDGTEGASKNRFLKEERREDELQKEMQPHLHDRSYQCGYDEGRKLQIYQEQSQLDKTLPLFQIDMLSKRVRIGNYEKHDNAPRMIFLSRYIEQKVLPFLPSNVASHLHGYYNVELHDSYTYLEGDHKKYKNCLVWSKKKDDDGPILMPDIYHLANYGERLVQHKDTYDWGESSLPFDDTDSAKNQGSHKNNKIGFWGTTTGNKDPKKNERIKKCLWFKENDPEHKVSDCFITRIAQMSHAEIVAAYPSFSTICARPVTFQDQYRYKFLLDIPGNTCSWDRIPIILNSNSLLFRLPCDDMCYYHHLLEEYKHYVPVTENDVFEKRNYYLENPEESLSIIKNAQAFVKEFCNSDSAQRYMIGLFTAAASKRKGV